MDFTRQPIIETVITPKEGCKLVVRNSKSAGQEEYFVDAVEVVSFSNALFLRSTERPKPFLLPATDYEILEVREARMVLKNVGLDRTIKIGGGREAPAKQPKEVAPEKGIQAEMEEEISEGVEVAAKPEGRAEKKRERRRQYRKRRGREEEASKEEALTEAPEVSEEGVSELPKPQIEAGEAVAPPVKTITPILPPPTTLISETIARYKGSAEFKGAFYTKEEEKPVPAEGESQEKPSSEAESPLFDISEQDEEEIYRQRSKQPLTEDFESPSENQPEEENRF